MPWKECDKVSERMKFVGRLLNGEKMTDLCREMGISRKTGHKIWKRYQTEGIEALNDRSSRPWRCANQTPAKVEKAILNLKEQYPSWGAPKILTKLPKEIGDNRLPARSTVHAILDRHGLVKKRKGRSTYKSTGTSLSNVTESNQLWCADFKGQFRMRNHQYCYPLTVTDQYSRYLLACDGFDNNREKGAIECFKIVFKEHGLPDAIRTDNGVPFASRSLFGLSKLAILWLRLGIKIERIKPGHPEQNGRHERMHRTLKEAVTKPAASNLLQQQEKFDEFVTIFNQERPHEGLGMQCPADVYKPSLRPYPKVLEEYDYQGCLYTKRISKCGKMKLKGGKQIFISEVFGGQEIGIFEVEDGVWGVRFLDYDLGYYCQETHIFNPAQNPFLEISNENM